MEQKRSNGTKNVNNKLPVDTNTEPTRPIKIVNVSNYLPGSIKKPTKGRSPFAHNKDTIELIQTLVKEATKLPIDKYSFKIRDFSTQRAKVTVSVIRCGRYTDTKYEGCRYVHFD